MITVVYPYMHSLANGDQNPNGMCELRWSLRSLCKHAKFDFNVVLVGDKPEWYTGDHIPTYKDRGMRYANAFDIAHKLNIICDSPIITDNFIYMYDDIYMVNDCSISDFEKVVALGSANRNSMMKDGSGPYRELFSNTVRAINMDKFYVYETHLPRVLNKERLNIIHKAYDLKRRPLLFSTLYFNEYFEQPDIVLTVDGKTVDNKIKASIYRKMSYDAICQEAEGKLWMNNSQNAFGESLKKFLNERFLDKCKYEK